MRAVRHPPRSRSPRRSAVVTLEVIIALPVFIIALMAIAEFGLLLANELYVEMASRTGAQVASQLNTISQTNGNPVPVTVRDAVAAELAKIGINDFHVRLEHNIDFSGMSPAIGPVVELMSTVNAGPTNCPDPPTVTLSPNRTYVRVTVCVKTSALAPNLLALYGFDLSTRVSDETTLRRYAL